jgi:hypothetical protein
VVGGLLELEIGVCLFTRRGHDKLARPVTAEASLGE